MKNPQNIDAYIKSFAPDVQVVLEKVRGTIKKAAPKAEETIKYGIPTFKQNDNLVHFGGFKKHIGFFPSPSAITAFKKELKPYKTTKGTVQFPLGEPIPYALIRKITKFRVSENLKEATKSSK